MLTPDTRVLGQILAAQNILFVLPTEKSIAEFYASALASLPGARAGAAFVCRAPAPSKESFRATPARGARP
jgi:hypothetical protein